MADKNNPIESIDLSMKQLAAGFGGRNLKEGGSGGVAIQALAAEIAEQNKIAQDNKTDFDRNKILMDLVMSTKASDKEGKANSLALRSQFKASQERLAQAIENGDDKAAQLEKDNQSEILANAETEENRREANKAIEKQSTLLGKMSKGISGLVGFAKDNAMAIGGGLLAGLAIFSPELMEKIVNRVIEVLASAFKIVESLLEGDIEGALELFKGEWKAFTGAFIFFFGGTIVKVLKGVFKGFKILKNAVQAYRMFLATNYAGGMIAHFKDMMKNLGNTLMKPIRFLVNAARTFKVFMLTTFIPGIISSLSGMMKALGGKIFKALKFLVVFSRIFSVFTLVTFIPGMIAAFSGMMAAMVPILIALAPIILPILAIAALIAGIGYGLVKMRDALGFESVFDVVMLGVAHLKDSFAHIQNFFIKLSQKIAGMAGALLDMLGIEIPDSIKNAAELELKETNNLEKAIAEGKQKKIDADAKRAEEAAAAEAGEAGADPNAVTLDQLNAMIAKEEEAELKAKAEVDVSAKLDKFLDAMAVKDDAEAPQAGLDLLDQQQMMMQGEFDAMDARADLRLQEYIDAQDKSSTLDPVEVEAQPIIKEGLFGKLFSSLAPSNIDAMVDKIKADQISPPPLLARPSSSDKIDDLSNLDRNIGDQIANDSANNEMLREELVAHRSEKPPVVISQKGGNVTNNNTTNNSTRSYKRPRAWGSNAIDSSYA